MTSLGGRPRPRGSDVYGDCVRAWVAEGAKLEESGRLDDWGTAPFAGRWEFSRTSCDGSFEQGGATEASVALFVVFDVSPSSGCHCDASGDLLGSASAVTPGERCEETSSETSLCCGWADSSDSSEDVGPTEIDVRLLGSALSGICEDEKF